MVDRLGIEHRVIKNVTSNAEVSAAIVQSMTMPSLGTKTKPHKSYRRFWIRQFMNLTMNWRPKQKDAKDNHRFSLIPNYFTHVILSKPVLSSPTLIFGGWTSTWLALPGFIK